MSPKFKIAKIASTIFLILGVIGLISIPEDLKAWGSTISIWGKEMGSFFENVDKQSILLICFSLSAFGFAISIFSPFIIEKYHRWLSDDLEFITEDGFPCGEMYSWEDEDGNLTIRQIRRVGIKNNKIKKTICGVKVRLKAMYKLKDLKVSVNPQLPQNLRVRGKKSESVDLSPGETEYWDVIKFWEEETKGKLSDIFICCFDKKSEHHFRRSLYKAVVTIYANDMENFEKEFIFGVNKQNLLVFMPWDRWLNEIEKKKAK